ncbi:MAG: hypothetical protein ACI9SE_003541 [Neolewinella sp.]|jgi:hypothetical protein
MIKPTQITFWCLAALMPVSQLSAQMGGGDPSKEIKEIAAAIDRQLKEIDDLLRESGRSGQKRNKPKELLEKASEGSTVVQDGIEKLIEKLNDMKNQGGQGQPSGEPKPGEKGQQGQSQDGQPQDGQPQQGQSGQQRRENQNPDFVQQPQEGQQPGKEGEKPGDKPGQKPGDKPGEGQANGEPKGGKQGKDGGQNRDGKKPPNSPTGPGQPGTGEGEWGDLQPYLNFLRNRGSSPKVPEKFRKYYEAYLKNKSKGK